MVSLVNSHTNATRIGRHLWEIDLRFAPGLPPALIPEATAVDSPRGTWYTSQFKNTSQKCEAVPRRARI